MLNMDITARRALADMLEEEMRQRDFGDVVRVTEDGGVYDDVPFDVAPVVVVELFAEQQLTDAMVLEATAQEPSLEGWQLFGRSNQGGQVMHASEVIGGGLAAHMADNPGRYAMVVVEVMGICHKCDDDDCYLNDAEPDVAGWVLVRRD